MNGLRGTNVCAPQSVQYGFCFPVGVVPANAQKSTCTDGPRERPLVTLFYKNAIGVYISTTITKITQMCNYDFT